MPAAAVIPAPVAYIKVVAVKKLVVGFQGFWRLGSASRSTWPPDPFPFWKFAAALRWVAVCSLRLVSARRGDELQIFYFEKIRVFKAGGLCLEYISMG